MSRRKDVHIPKVWEAEEISDDDDEDIEEMQKEVEDILSKITSKKKTTQVSQETPVQFDIKIEVEEFDEQPSTASQSHNKNPSGSTSQKHGTTNTTKQNTQNVNKIQTTDKQPQQSLLIQKSSGSRNPQVSKSKDSLCQKSISPSPKPNTYKNKNNPTNSLSIEQNKSTNPSLYQHIVLETQNIRHIMQILSKYGNIADNYIYILMKNYENIPTVSESTHVQMALQKVLEVWNNWFLKDPLNRGAPLLYKCKDCGWAWWHLNSFLEHIRNVHKRQNWKLRFEFEATNGESYIALKMSSKFDKSLPAVRIVNAPCWRCGMLPGDKYQNFNTTSLSYHCQCGVQFITCYEYRLHLDVCPTGAPKVKKLVNYKCYLCFLRFDTSEELQRHRLLSHTVRSDLPASWTPIKKCIHCCMSHFDGISDCPAVKRMVPCGFCTKTFSTIMVMHLHQSFSKENYKCRLCDEILKRECMEMLHLVKHTNNYIVLFKCMICDNSNTYFYNDMAYNIHMLSKHPCRDQPAMKVPVPVKCLQDSGYNVQTPEMDKNVVPPPSSHTYDVPVTIQGNKSVLKRKADQKESPCKRVQTTKNSSHENEVNTMDEIKVEEDIEDFINNEMEINEMILLNNKESEVLKIKLEDFEEDLSEGNKLNDPNNEGNSNINSNKNNPNTANGLKDKSFQPFDDEINITEGCDKVLEIKKENTEDDALKKGEKLNIAGTLNGSEINSNKNKPTACNSSKKENCDSSRISLTNNDDKVIKNNNDKLNATANCIKPVEENIILEMRNEATKSNGMLDFELQIQKTIIHSNAACNDLTHLITNVIVKHKTDDNYNTKENNTSTKPIHTHEPRKENVVNSNTEEKELQNSNVEKRSDNKEDSVPQSKCVVNQNELNVNTNKDTQEGEKNKNITTKKVLDKQGINSSKNNDSHEKDIPIETSINHNVPDKETLVSKLVDNPGPSKTVKVEQDSLIGNSNVKIKEEVLDDDTDDEKLVIAEFTDLITDKSVTLEVKVEPQEIFENDMIDLGKGKDNTDNEDVGVDDDRENSGEYITWTPHLGVVRGGVNMEEDSDDDDLPLMDIKRKKKKMYACKRCKFNGHHLEYQEHKKMCVRQKKYRKRFYPEDCDSYECTICEKQFGTLIKYLKHLTEHGYKWLQCPECMDKFPTKARLSQHVLHHINKNYVPLRGITSARDYGFTMQCTQCDDEVQPHEFFCHWERHLASARRLQRKPPLAIEDCAPHSPMLRDLIAILLDRYTIRDDDEHKPLRWCKMCNRPFTRDNECKRHYIEHLLDDAFSHMTDTRRLKCQICGEMWDKCSDFRLHIRSHASMPVYRCELCRKTFSDSSNFAKHRKVHNLCDFTCDMCGKKFNRKIWLVEHIKFHEKTKPITCEFEGCSKVCLSQSAYNKHVKLVHHRSKYRCQICKKTLSSNKEMWDHKWEEHRLRKVIADCPICHMQFRKYLDVKAHVRSAHADCLPDLKRLNKLSPEEKIGNVAHLVHDAILDPEPEEDIIKIEIEDNNI